MNGSGTKGDLERIVSLERYPLADLDLRSRCRGRLDRDGALVLEGFLTPQAISAVRNEGEARQHLAFFSTQTHNAYLLPDDPGLPGHHPRNRAITSSKGCITDDLIPAESPLRTLYDSPEFQDFLCAVLGESSLHAYADPLSSINLHYAHPGQELGWHFDNSSFAITLMIQEPERGGKFEYVGALRDADEDEMRYDEVEQVLDGKVEPLELNMEVGALVLFRGRNSIHRVAPVEGSRTRILVVLAYNTEPGISLSETARMTFYGRLQ